MGNGTPDKPFGFHDATIGGGWQVPGEPYTSAHDKSRPHEEFRWWRPRMLGGRTNHWGRISLRNGPYDFKPRSRDGLGLRLADDLRGRSSRTTRRSRCSSASTAPTRGWRTRPTRPRACCCRAPKGRAAELLAQKHGKTLGIPVVPIHRAVLTKHQDYQNDPRRSCTPDNARAQKIVQRGDGRAHRRASGRRRAAAGARSGRTTSPPRCTCRPRWRPATSTSSPTPTAAR